MRLTPLLQRISASFWRSQGFFPSAVSPRYRLTNPPSRKQDINPLELRAIFRIPIQICHTKILVKISLFKPNPRSSCFRVIPTQLLYQITASSRPLLQPETGKICIRSVRVLIPSCQIPHLSMLTPLFQSWDSEYSSLFDFPKSTAWRETNIISQLQEDGNLIQQKMDEHRDGSNFTCREERILKIMSHQLASIAWFWNGSRRKGLDGFKSPMDQAVETVPN